MSHHHLVHHLDKPAAPGATLHLTWEVENPHGCVRVARHPLNPRDRWPPHDHEFAEVFWVESGQVAHHINGIEEHLVPGDLRCIRPRDAHLFRTGDGDDGGGPPGILMNVSFELEPLAGLAERYGEDWPWRADGAPRGVRLAPSARERFAGWIDILAGPEPRRLDLESFLLDVARVVSGDALGPRGSGLPAWLAQALEAFNDPRHLRGGVPELARLCGRSQEHLNRIVRACQDRRATDLVNAMRLDWAAARLRLSDLPVAEIAGECGLPNLAHFYKLFRASFGVTPAAFRSTAQSAMPGKWS
jgi:AraC family cel operon transcriptional repressor